MADREEHRFWLVIDDLSVANEAWAVRRPMLPLVVAVFLLLLAAVSVVSVS